ncbi:MFS transporter [Nocardia wallacei]|uniref:MFS transporter n=1 Tax=Nocardia wallacei TaxID=480035 RepID=UPI002453E7A4|nr:MFS transporter [Nocardia wallacei]
MTELDSPADHGHRRPRALAVAALGLAMVSLDGTAVGVALPAVIRDLGLSLTQAQWVTAVYALVFAALLITAWRVGDRFGHRRIFAAGVVVFVAGSLLAAAADDASTLIWGRLVQGIGGAAVLPGALATARAVLRERDRVLAFAAWGVVVSAVAVVGPVFGGWLSSSFTWPWIFLVNVPIGVVVLAGIVLFVPETTAPEPVPGPDIDGLLLSAAGFALVVFALIEGQTYGWWKPVREFDFFGLTWSTRAASSPIPLLLLLGAVLLVLFALWERHRAHAERAALCDLSWFAEREFRWGSLAVLAVTLSEFGLLFVLPLYLVNVLDLTTLGGGCVLAAMALGALAAGGVVAWRARLLAPVWIVRAGLALQAVAVAVTALCVSPDVSPWLLGVLLACYGIGLGAVAAQLAGALLADGRSVDTGRWAAWLTVRQVGFALGPAVLGGVLGVSLARVLPDRLSDVPGLQHRAVDEVAVATRESAGGAVTVLREHDGTQAVVDALARGFSDATRLTLLAAAVILFLGFLAASRIPLRAGPTRVPPVDTGEEDTASADDRAEGDSDELKPSD